MADLINEPPHYGMSRFGCECIDIARRMAFCPGNAFKYVWRHEDKGTPAVDLGKALVYLRWAREEHQTYGVPLVYGEARDYAHRFVKPYLTSRDRDIYRALMMIAEERYDAAIVKIELHLGSISVPPAEAHRPLCPGTPWCQC